MTPTEALEEAVRIAGGESQLIAKMRPYLPSGSKVERGHLYYWRNKAKAGIPAELCAAVEAAVEGRVTRRSLRPDVFGTPAPRVEA